MAYNVQPLHAMVQQLAILTVEPPIVDPLKRGQHLNNGQVVVPEISTFPTDSDNV